MKARKIHAHSYQRKGIGAGPKTDRKTAPPPRPLLAHCRDNYIVNSCALWVNFCCF